MTSPPRDEVKSLCLAQGRRALAVQVVEPPGLPGALAALGLAGPRPVLVLVGGAAGLDPNLRPILTSLFRALVTALCATGAAVMDGGTRSGVMALMGEAAADSDLTLVGVAAVGTVRLPGDGDDGPALSSHRDHRTDLDPGHSRFLLVPGVAWGDESPWLAAAASVLAGGLASLTLVAGGGDVTARDLREGLRLGRPALVLAGTGGTADGLAAHLRGGGPVPFDLPREAAGNIEVIDVERAYRDLPPLVLQRLGQRVQAGGHASCPSCSAPNPP